MGAIRILVIIIFFGHLFSCEKDIPTTSIKEDVLREVVIPKGFPDVVYPEGNEFTSERWQLGKKLFYDTRLSSTNTLSCASCHKQQYAFSDNVSLSTGVEDRPGIRNAPSLANVAFHPYYTREGGINTLEKQVLVPIQEHNEFDFNIVKIADTLSKDVQYQNMSNAAYQRKIDPYVITRALSNFERTLISGNSKYDQYVSNKTTFSSSESLGKELFFSSRTHCSECHSGFNFTNYEFKNNGLYVEYQDEGRFRLTQLENDRALFKTPSLRNIELTAPYMHDGSMMSLTEVINHYNMGGKNHKNKSSLIQPLNLNSTEKQALIDFLLTLTDREFVENKYFIK